MAARILPNLGLKAFFTLGEDGWNDEVDFNFLKLSVLTQGGIIGIVTTKPGAPVQGDTYLMSATATSNPNAFAVYDNSQWIHFAPNSGWTVYNRANDSFVTWNGTAWLALSLAKLRALGAIDDSVGIMEQTGVNSFTKRGIGVGAAEHLLTRATADARFSAIGHTHPATGVVSFNARSGAVTLSSADVQTALGFLPATSHPHLTSISALGNTSGLLEQTGSNSFTKRAVGTNSPGDILSLSHGDARYQGLHATLTGMTNIPAGEFGVIEQFGSRTFRVRAIGTANNSDLLTRGAADSLYIGASAFAMSQLSDVPDSYVGKAENSLVLNQAENGFEFRAPRQVTVKNFTASTTLTLADAGAHIRVLHSTGATVTIPKSTAVNFPIGTTITVEQTGLGMITLNPDAGVNLDFRAGYSNYTDSQHSVVHLRKTNTDRWLAYGDLEPAGTTIYTADSVLIEADNDAITADAV
jgi:hypothetical protein